MTLLTLETIFQQEGLSLAHLTQVEASFSHHLAYHNYAHCCGVAMRAYQGALFYHLPPIPPLLAGLYHDADHQGAQPDTVNIEASLRVARKAGLDQEVLALIEATEFPHRGTTSLAGQVVRDADMLETIVRPSFLPLYEEESGSKGSREWASSQLSTEWAKAWASELL